MNDRERMLKIATASESVLKKIDQILLGRKIDDGEPEQINLKTVTYKEAARRLGVSMTTIYRMAKSGAIKRVMLNGVKRIRLQSLVDLVTENKEGITND